MTDHDSFSRLGKLLSGLGVVILAAGASSRMGRPKLLLPWNSTSVLGHLIGQWQSVGARQIAVVCSAGDNAMVDEQVRLGFPCANRILNPTPERGMFSSIQSAARWNGWEMGLNHWALVLGDQPHLRVETLRDLLDFASLHSDKICQPARNNRPRHPVVLPKAIFERLKDLRDATLKQFLQNNASEVALREVDDPGLDVDLDTPEDYQAALRLFQTGPG
jgi:molybdenum cofactor cytidylyltransferase